MKAMIKKERLLAGLDELKRVEEDVITLYANFSKALLKQTDDIAPDKKKKMDVILTQLYKDSTRHKKIVDKLIEEVSGSQKSEY